jgi:hypothetical protein
MTDQVRDWMKDGSRSPSLDEFLAVYNDDDSVWWMLAGGHHQNLFEAAVDELTALRAQRDAALAACDEAERFFAEQNIMRPLLTTVAVRAALGVQPEGN